MNILRKAFKIFNGSSWDEYHLKTDSKQVVHTKADGTDTTVEEQLLALYSTLTGAISTKTYSMTLTANNYVPPFSMFGEGIIPDADIKKYGSPIAICAIQKSSAPGAAALRWHTGRSVWQYIVCSNQAETSVIVTFLKLNQIFKKTTVITAFAAVATQV